MNSFFMQLLCCDKCQNTYHPECLGPNYPAKPSRHKHIWVCMKCVKCRSCGATTPGTQNGACWTHDFSLCYSCGQLMDKGRQISCKQWWQILKYEIDYIFKKYLWSINWWRIFWSIIFEIWNGEIFPRSFLKIIKWGIVLK